MSLCLSSTVQTLKSQLYSNKMYKKIELYRCLLKLELAIPAVMGRGHRLLGLCPNLPCPSVGVELWLGSWLKHISQALLWVSPHN